MLGRALLLAGAFVCASLAFIGTGIAAPYSAAGLACTSTAVRTSSDSGHVPAAQYRSLAKIATNSTVRAIAKRLAKSPKDTNALGDFGEWCKDRYPKFGPIQRSDFEYDN
jgi:hypothetical protein